MQNAATMQSGEEAPIPAAAIEPPAAAVAPELAGTVSETALVMAPESAAVREVKPAEEAPQPVHVTETAAAEAPTQGAEVSVLIEGDGSKSPSAAPVSPSEMKERQISVDPASLRRLGMVADEDSPLSLPSVFTEVVVQSPLLPPLRRPTFVGASLPCSAASSPVHSAGPAGAGARWEENPATPSPRSALSSLARQHSAALARLVVAPAAVAPLALSRSASRAEGRTMAPHEDDEERFDPKALVAAEDGFTCGALCMLIPGFSKKKPAAGMAMSNMQRQQSSGARARRNNSASRVSSLERFECGSWSPPPPAAARDSDGCHALEVPKISYADDTECPVKMAFVFNGEAPPTRGILKNSASSRLSSDRPSTSSQRHVRFSAAAASCPSSPSGVVTPRLARARSEFNTFLEAQSA